MEWLRGSDHSYIKLFIIKAYSDDLEQNETKYKDKPIATNGYARVSTTDQDLSIQQNALKASLGLKQTKNNRLKNVSH